MSANVEVDGLRPGKVRNKTTVAKKFAVVVDFDPPNAWEDGTLFTATGDNVSSAVSHYEVDLLDSANNLVAQELHVLRTKVRFDRDVGTGPFKSRVRAIGHDLEYQTEDAASGAASPEGIAFSEVTGTVTKPQMGQLGISRYGSTAAMNAAAAVDGDIWINTDYSPSRPYRRVAGAWVYQVSGDVLQVGTVIADGVVAGAIDGHTINGVLITGSTFRTATTGTRIEITSGNVMTFYTASGPIAQFNASVLNLNVGSDTPGATFVVGLPFKLEKSLTFTDVTQTTNTPGVVLGTAEALPGSSGNIKPFQWLKITNPGGSTVWIPCFKP